MRMHLLAITAFAIASALANLPSTAFARPSGIIVCDRQGCRPENPPAAREARPARERAAVRRSSRSREAAKASPRASYGGGSVRSGKTGATARVDAASAGRFQAYVDDVESTGAKVLFMGGWRRGHCSERHKHSCGGGEALDLCQYRRGVVDARCHLPSPPELERIAARHGLVEGGRWCSSDYGHAEVGPGARACPGRPYAVGRAITPPALRHAKIHHVRLARR